MDDDFDIYGDLPLTCDIKDNVIASGNNEECEELKKEVTDLSSKLQKLQKINETLEVNLSSLLKTAKAEIARKDKMIDELRKQVDDMSFKRGYFSRNKREINDKQIQRVPTPNAHEYNNPQPECIANLPVGNVNKLGYDEDASDYENFNSKSHKTRYTKNLTESFKLTTTVFTERLRKRIIEEDEAEQKRKLEEQEEQNLLLENNHENNRKINIDDKENQSHFSIWNSNVDNTNLKCKGTEHDYIDNINGTEGTTAYLENQHRLVGSTKVSVKRTDNCIDMPCNKRRKLDTEQNTCISKDSLSRKEDVFNGYDDEMISNTSINKFDYKEDNNTCIEWNDPHCNAQFERDHSRLRSSDGYYKRKERYKKSNGDYNYSKESTYYHEKDKYNNTRNRSPVLRYSDKKHKYHDDRYKDHRDKFDRRRNFHDKDEETPIIPNKRFYDLRHKDKIKFNRKYNSKDFYSPRHKESRYSNLRASRSASHERSKSGSRERTNYKSYDRKSSKSTKTNNDLEKHVGMSIKKKNETNESKATSTLMKKDDTSKKSIKTNNMESLESTEIIDKSQSKSSTNSEHKKVENTTKENVNVNNNNKSDSELVSSKPMDVQTANSRAKVVKEENVINTEHERNGNDNRAKEVEDVIVEVTTNVNISTDIRHIPLDENKQDHVITLTNTIGEKKSKCDEHIVQHQIADNKAINTCDDISNLPRNVSNSVIDISAEAKQENNVTNKNDVETFQSNALKNKHGLPKNSLENETSTLNDREERPTVQLQQTNDQDNNGNDHVTSKDFESKKKSLEQEKSKVIVLARRRKRVQLADNNASMTIVINANNANLDTELKNNIENNLKSRACKVSRSYKNVL